MTKIDHVVELIVALRDVTEETGTITKRSQNRLLQVLTDAELTEVAGKLRSHYRLRAVLGGSAVREASDVQL